ncbi:MAG TPA: hypothetical protein PLK08_01335, partial [Phycisphaerae bacterium]|nr:hypothetical protein [Phycisphaerae bacterium]
DAYDLLDYHLQVPREYLDAGQITPLFHNVYSFYPLGAEMIYLFMMSLQGGVNEGMYLATLVHGLFGVLAVAGMFFGLRDSLGRFRPWAAALMLATVPGVIFYSWLAFSELAMICYMVLGLFWLKRWIVCRDIRTAIMTGLMCGCACSVKYLSVGMIALPIFLVMFLFAIAASRRIWWHVITAVILCIVVMGPWLVRNAVFTKNPVFPLATKFFGRGHWSSQVEQRWVHGHSGGRRPPVPAVPGWDAGSENRLKMLWTNFFGSEFSGLGVTWLAILSSLWIVVEKKWRHDAWLFALMFIIAVQLAMWFLFAPNMPPRFILPSSAAAVLLAAEGLTRLRWRGKSTAFLSSIILAAVVIFDFAGAFGIWLRQTKDTRDIVPVPADVFMRQMSPGADIYKLGPQAKVLLVGDAAVFYYPSNVIYCTPFDNNPLDIVPQEAVNKLANMGVTHILVNWREIWRLAGTYGFPAKLTSGLYDLQLGGKTPPTLPVLDELIKRGATVQHFGGEYPFPMPQERRKKWNPFLMPPNWPVFSIYTLPDFVTKNN